jgi:hypothetical protein
VSASHRRLARWLKVTGTVYALGAADYVARPRAAIATLNSMGGEPMEPEGRGLYNSLAGAYMATIAALALSASADPHERSVLIPPLLVAKVASAGFLLFQYAETRRRGFALAAGVDAFLFGVTAGLYSSLE